VTSIDVTKLDPGDSAAVPAVKVSVDAPPETTALIVGCGMKTVREMVVASTLFGSCAMIDGTAIVDVPPIVEALTVTGSATVGAATVTERLMVEALIVDPAASVGSAIVAAPTMVEASMSTGSATVGASTSTLTLMVEALTVAEEPAATVGAPIPTLPPMVTALTGGMVSRIRTIMPTPCVPVVVPPAVAVSTGLADDVPAVTVPRAMKPPMSLPLPVVYSLISVSELIVAPVAVAASADQVAASSPMTAIEKMKSLVVSPGLVEQVTDQPVPVVVSEPAAVARTNAPTVPVR
jgi:hypothetical protein